MKLYSDEALAQILDKDIFHQISTVADGLGVECYVVGGYVRDIFLERPSADIDVVVVGSGIEVAKGLKQLLGKRAHLSVFKNFGTAQVKIRERQRGDGPGDEDVSEIEVEFVGARKESYSHDSRKPVVENGTLEDDQNRRDFTINAMALCLNKDRFGELVDPFDGLADMEDKTIATPLDPDITFSDDPLRMMRCIRFATQLNFHIEEDTFEALSRNKERIKIISAERIAEELNKILLSPAPSKGFVELERCGLLPLIFPELALLQGVETKDGKAHKDNFYHTLEVLDNVAKATATPADISEGNGNWDSPKDHILWLRWAALLHDIGKPKSKRFDPIQGWTFHNHNDIGEKMIPSIFRRMKLPMNEKMKFVQKLVQMHMRPIAIADSEVTDSAVRRLLFDAGDDIDDLMLLCTADITSKNDLKKKKFADNYITVRTKLEEIEVKDRIRNFQPPISGEDIMEMFGLNPCKEVGILKTAIKDAILDGKIPNEYEPAEKLLIEEAKKLGLNTITTN